MILIMDKNQSEEYEGYEPFGQSLYDPVSNELQAYKPLICTLHLDKDMPCSFVWMGLPYWTQTFEKRKIQCIEGITGAQ